MSAAYDSALNLSFDVRGGLFMRQMHHWAALLFMAAIVVHMLRIFFTGAFRKPRETNWIIGVVMLVLALLMGFAGYSLPDDVLSGTGLRIVSAIMLSIPVIGTWAHFAVFGGEFPGEQIIGRFYIVHVLLIPAILLALIAVHLLILVKQKHTQCPGPGRTEHNVVGKRMFPAFAAKATGLSSWSSASSRCWAAWSRSTRSGCSARTTRPRCPPASQPDWYVMFLDGSTRLFPAWDINLPGDYTIPALFWPTVVLAGAMFTVLALYPFIERKLTRDKASHHLLQRPRDVPVRTALGAMALTFYVVLMISGGNDVIADKFDISLNAMTWAGRIGVHRPAADRLRAHLPHLPGSAAARPRGARARRRDRHHPAPAGRRVHRGAPAARPGRRARPRHARLRRCSGAEEDEPRSAAPAGRSAGFFTPIEEPAQVELEQRAEDRGAGRELTRR